ncbi:MAG: stage II sporulation protein D [Firmicutes bacterium]|nr:stage II sporulation protein D [Bacillota bacterium]
MSRRRRRRLRRQALSYFRLIFLLLVLFIGLPLLFAKGIRFAWEDTTNIPVVQVWNTQTNSLMKMSLEDYVKGVVAAEMPIHFDLEALKAQAVAARTYAYQRIIKDERISDHPEAHLSTDYRSGQAWVSSDQLRNRWGLFTYYFNKHKVDRAVDETRGVIATYQGQPILAVYHSTSGGRTENSEHYWSTALPYLRSVNDPYGNHSPYSYTKYTISVANFLNAMGIEQLGQVKVVERYPSGRVKTLEAGNQWFSGREVRERLGLRSTWFTVDLNNNNLEFNLWGYGHGVGMSQYGADGMAKQGYDYRQILQYYYQDISLHQAY